MSRTSSPSNGDDSPEQDEYLQGVKDAYRARQRGVTVQQLEIDYPVRLEEKNQRIV